MDERNVGSNPTTPGVQNDSQKIPANDEIQNAREPLTAKGREDLEAAIRMLTYEHTKLHQLACYFLHNNKEYGLAIETLKLELDAAMFYLEESFKDYPDDERHLAGIIGHEITHIANDFAEIYVAIKEKGLLGEFKNDDKYSRTLEQGEALFKLATAFMRKNGSYEQAKRFYDYVGMTEMANEVRLVRPREFSALTNRWTMLDRIPDQIARDEEIYQDALSQFIQSKEKFGESIPTEVFYEGKKAVADTPAIKNLVNKIRSRIEEG